jgi:hypothetical protein
MPVKGSECQVSKLVNSDTCPRPTTGAGDAGHQPEGGRWQADEGAIAVIMHRHFLCL